MIRGARHAVAPAYLLACLILGGSVQGAWQNAVLQLAGIAILAWVAAVSADTPLPRGARRLLLLAMAAVAIVALQLVPLPPSLWAHGLRGQIATGYPVLGLRPPWLPISLSPSGSLAALIRLIPPLAMFVALVRLKAPRTDWLVAALLAGTLAGILLGALQVASAGSSPRWYPYAETNFGSAVGFFANANHMATLLLVSLPFAAAIGAAAPNRTSESYSAVLAVVGAIILVLLVGIALNGSLAGYALAVPVLAGSALVILPAGSLARRVAAGIGALTLILSVVALATTGIGGGKLGQAAGTAVQSRAVILKTTARAIADTMPFGSGLGSFVRVYPLYESRDPLVSDYAIHAHDDYAELALELGAAGILLTLGFLLWWLSSVRSLWRRGAAAPFARAATIASAAVLVHSLVDFPLRTAAISACFAMCLALLVRPPQPAPRQATDLRPPRHLAFE